MVYETHGYYLNRKQTSGKTKNKMDVICRDRSQILALQGWRRTLEDREEWRSLPREASVQKRV